MEQAEYMNTLVQIVEGLHEEYFYTRWAIRIVCVERWSDKPDSAREPLTKMR